MLLCYSVYKYIYLLFWVFFSLYFNLYICYFLSYSLKKKVIMLSLSLVFLILSCNSTLGWWIFMVFNISILGWYILVLCFQDSPPQVLYLSFIALVWSFFFFFFFELIMSFISLEVIIWIYIKIQFTWLCLWMCLPIICCNYMINFDFHNNFLKRMRNLNNKFES